METRKQLITIQVDYKCPECEIGYLRPSGRVLTSNPPQYPHRCSNHECDFIKTFTAKKYPHLDYEETDVTKEVLTEDQISQKIVDGVNYNNLCARATLYPGLEIDEIPVMTIEDLKENGEKKKLKLQIVDPTEVIIRTHHFYFESELGTRLHLDVNGHKYVLKYTGELDRAISEDEI